MLYISQITLEAEVSISGNCGNGESIPESRLIWLPNNKLAGEAFVLLCVEEFKIRCMNGFYTGIRRLCHTGTNVRTG